MRRIMAYGLADLLKNEPWCWQPVVARIDNDNVTVNVGVVEATVSFTDLSGEQSVVKQSTTKLARMIVSFLDSKATVTPNFLANGGMNVENHRSECFYADPQFFDSLVIEIKKVCTPNHHEST